MSGCQLIYTQCCWDFFLDVLLYFYLHEADVCFSSVRHSMQQVKWRRKEEEEEGSVVQIPDCNFFHRGGIAIYFCAKCTTTIINLTLSLSHEVWRMNREKRENLRREKSVLKYFPPSAINILSFFFGIDRLCLFDLWMHREFTAKKTNIRTMFPWSLSGFIKKGGRNGF